jgi:hypothetical protein
VAADSWEARAIGGAPFHHSQDDDGPGEGSTSLFAAQARPVDGGIRLMDTGGYLVSIARLNRRAQRIITYSIDNR